MNGNGSPSAMLKASEGCMSSWRHTMPYYNVICENCGKEVSIYRSPSAMIPRFCSAACRDISRSLALDKETLYKLYVQDRLTIKEIASHYRAAPKTIRLLLTTYGISWNNRQRAPFVPTETELRVLYEQERLSTLVIAARYNVSDVAVSYWLKKYGISVRSKWERDHFNDNASIPSEEQLRTFYSEGHNCESIAEIFGVSGGFILKLMKQFGIELRAPNLQKKLKCKDGHVVRSGLELLVDNWLYDHALPHVCEPKLPFRGKADFLIGDIWVEVWGISPRKADSPFGGKVAEKYLARRKVKEKLYREHLLRLIGLERSDVLHRLDEILSPVFLLDSGSP